MDKLTKYYNELKTSIPPEVMTERILHAIPTAEAKSLPLKKVTVIMLTAVVLLVGGISAAAASGLLDLSSIFGDRLTADEELAGRLISDAEDFTWTVSDNDYMIELKGVTGSHSDMLMVYEIKRVDGSPVVEHMTNIPEDSVLCSAVKIDLTAPPQGSDYYNASDSNRYILNDEGNVEIYNRISTDGNICGHYYSVDATNLYPKTLLESFEKENDIFLWKQQVDTPTGFYQSTEDFKAKQPLDIALNDERIIGLELEWSIGFTYTPSETAQLSRSIAENNTFSLKYWRQLGGIGEKSFEITSSHFSSVGGRINGEYYGDELKGSLFEKYNDVFLILTNGEEIPCTISVNSLGYYSVEKRTDISAEIQYSDAKNGTITAIEISELDAISINGEIYPFEK